MGVKRGLSADQLRDALSKEENANVRARIGYVLEAMRGETYTAIATNAGVSITTVSNWIKRYNKSGIAGLRDRAPGRPSSISDSTRSAIADAIQQLDNTQRRGSVSAIKLILEQEFGITLGDAKSVRRALRACGFEWRLVEIARSAQKGRQ